MIKSLDRKENLMAELPLGEFEVHYTRTVHTYVRVTAKTERTASKLAAQTVDELELGAMCQTDG
jgi:hypothetical protein